MESLGGKPRWIPHELNPSDCMTKIKGNTSSMLELMRKCTFKLTAESEEMDRRKEYREQTGSAILGPTCNMTLLEDDILAVSLILLSLQKQPH